MSVAVVQLGARMHYAVPRILAGAGLLARLYTDAAGDRGWTRLLRAVPERLRPAALRKLVARRIGPGIRTAAYPAVGIRYALDLRRAAGHPARLAEAHLAAGRRLGARAVGGGLANAGAVYAFNSAALGVFREARRRGIATVYEQTIAPVRTEWKLIEEEAARWPGWEAATASDDFYRPFAEVEAEEWGLADTIVCGSSFVGDRLAAEGAPVAASVVPYGVDLPASPPRPAPAGRPLRVLTVGAVGLRKGAPYVAAAAKALGGAAEFRWVGGVGLTDVGRAEVARHVDLVGAVPRPEMAGHYRWADVFLLPSVCEGSATATYEALAHGLPLVVTPNAGAPVPAGGGMDPVPVRDAEAVAARIRTYLDDPARWEAAHAAALAAVADLTVAAYGRRLLAALPPAALAPAGGRP